MKKYLLLFFLITSINGFPQVEDFKEFLNTGKDLVISPLYFDQNDWMNLGGVILITGGSFYLDDNVKSVVLRNTSNTETGYVSDNLLYQIPIVITAGTYLYGWIVDDDVVHQAGLDLIEATVYASGINSLIKFIAGRTRPYLTTDVTEFTPFRKKFVNASFGSGHATLAFSAATVLAKQSDNIFWKAGWFTAAGFIGAARIYHNMHWLSDVILGSAIGYFVGSYVTQEKGDQLSFGVIPGGVSLTIRF